MFLIQDQKVAAMNFPCGEVADDLLQSNQIDLLGDVERAPDSHFESRCVSRKMIKVAPFIH
ncbi:MAG: hypothetical protein QOH42_1641 [Blastocatellia bacterium]|jgi:hypothetical protein|nr:hypothetical protein [Blastocatellia bacterium]